MIDTFKFPNGYEVKIVRKQDIIDCIDNNIIDKDVALEIITQLEADAISFIEKGVWTGLPYLGSIRIPEGKQLEQSEENQALLAAAKETKTKEEFIIFRRQLRKDNAIKIEYRRLYRYELSKAVKRNTKLYKRLCKKHGDLYANLILYLATQLKDASEDERYNEY